MSLFVLYLFLSAAAAVVVAVVAVAVAAATFFLSCIVRFARGLLTSQ